MTKISIKKKTKKDGILTNMLEKGTENKYMYCQSIIKQESTYGTSMAFVRVKRRS